MRKILVVLVSLFCLVPVASAIQYGGIGGYPANPDPNNPDTSQWFIYTLNPGETVEDSLVVENTSSEGVNVKLYPADYTSSTDGGFALEQEVEPRDEVGAWVSLSATGVFVDAMSTVTVPFTLTVPNDSSLDVGEHMGGILLEKISGEESSSGGIQLNIRVGVRIYVTIPGDVNESVEVPSVVLDTDLDKRVGTVTTNIKNAGNVSEDVKVITSVENVYSFFDRIWGEAPVENERSLQVLRDDELISNFEFDLPFFSYVSVKSTIEYTDNKGEVVSVSSEPVMKWIYPSAKWILVTGLSLLCVVFFSILLFVKKKSRKHKYFY